MAREAKKSGGVRWRLWLGLAVAASLCVSTGMAAWKVRRYALTGAQFTLSASRQDALEIQGLTDGSRAKVRRVFAADFGGSVFAIPLAERRRRLLAIDWVEDAAVSRVWPDRLAVRIASRLFGPPCSIVDCGMRPDAQHFSTPNSVSLIINSQATAIARNQT